MLTFASQTLGYTFYRVARRRGRDRAVIVKGGVTAPQLAAVACHVVVDDQRHRGAKLAL